jgi:putative Holliday junction resolvase
MTILTQDECLAALRDGDRILALDVGAKTIGLATAVWGQELVMPLQTIDRVKFTRDAERLADVMADLGARVLVVGWPLLPDGRAGKRCQSVYDFTQELDRFLMSPPTRQADGLATSPSRGEVDGPVLITFQDERFSTARGDETVDNIGKTAGKGVNTRRRDAMIDALAAQEILKDFLFS